MKTTHRLAALLGLAGMLTLGACGTTSDPYNPVGAGSSNQSNVYAGYGIIHSIERVSQASATTGTSTGIGGTSIGLGTVAGAVVGGVVGHQVGSGSGNTAATVLGAAGGAYIGHEIEKRQQQDRQHQTVDAYKITVRMENGGYQALMRSTADDLRVGDHVRIVNGSVERY